MIVFSTPEIFNNEDVFLNALFDAGMEILHLRKPDSDIQDVSLLISKVKKEYHSRIVIHSYFNLINDFNLKGICFSEKNKHVYDSLYNRSILKAWPAHSVEALKFVPEGIDYVLLSPLFESISKKGYKRNWSLEELNVYMKKNDPRKYRLFALGGIDESNVKETLLLGFDDVAVLGGLWDYKKDGVEAIVRQFKRIEDQCKR